MNVITSYTDLLARKAPTARKRGIAGFARSSLSSHLFAWQRDCAGDILEMGGAGAFWDTGLGKTLLLLEVMEHARNATNGWALILVPLAVARQFEREGKRFGYPVRVIRCQEEAGEGINICNYDRLHLLDPSAFGAASLDEADILKAFAGKVSSALIAAFREHRFKVAATATPAPNSHMELGQYAAFLGVMSSNEMLSRFFINDTATASQQWRLKRHGVEAFWDWVASWARMATMPSDLGGDDAGFVLPPLKVLRHHAGGPAPILTLGEERASATTIHDVKRKTIEARAAVAVDLVTSEPDEPWVLWVDTDYESDAVMRALKGVPDVIEVRGSHKSEVKEARIDAFSTGSARVLVTKSSVCGYGLNWQHCARTAFVGRDYSYAKFYQASRRFHRYGQKREVIAHLICGEGEEGITAAIDRKSDDHQIMKRAMRAAMSRNSERESAVKIAYKPFHEGRLPAWLSVA